MKKSAYYAIKWSLCLFIIYSFIFPWIGLFNDAMDFETIAGKLIIWCIAGLVIFGLKEHDRKRNLKS